MSEPSPELPAGPVPPIPSSFPSFPLCDLATDSYTFPFTPWSHLRPSSPVPARLDTPPLLPCIFAAPLEAFKMFKLKSRLESVSELILAFLADQVSIIQPNSFFLKYNIHILYINWWCLTYDYAPKSPGYSLLFLCLVTLKAVYFVLFCGIFVFAQPYASSHTGPKLT